MNNKLPFAFPLSPEEIRSRRAAILAQLLAMDEGFCGIPVTSLHADTLRRMLLLYDCEFLSGWLSVIYKHIDITLSSRLTSSAGKFIYAKNPAIRMSSAEIRMSSDFLFRLVNGPFTLNGLSVSTPQEAFLIVLEHEICHAIETALFGSTGHTKRFLSLANGLFGHTDTHHSLPTRKQEAANNGLSVGSRVAFAYNRKQITGLISYIGKTATVMVPSLFGSYRDQRGKRYRKYRVPLDLLKKV